LTNKILIGSAIIVVVCLAPEFAILVDVGGIDLGFAFLVFYLKPALLWVKSKKEAVAEDLVIWHKRVSS